MEYYNITLKQSNSSKKRVVLGGKKTKDGKSIVVAIREGADKVIKIIDIADDVIDIVGDVIKKGTPLWHSMVDFFNDIFSALPSKIDYKGLMYNLTHQPTRGKAIDKLFYLYEGFREPVVAKEIVLFPQEAKTESQVRTKMRKYLRKRGFLH